jgi:hypothetical protein
MTVRSMMAWTCFWLGDGVSEIIIPAFGRRFEWPNRLFQWLMGASACWQGGRHPTQSTISHEA